MMYEKKFTKWIRWDERDSLVGIQYPGVYACAISKNNISGDEFSWISNIIYIGMTNSLAGLKGRLKQFDNTIVGKSGHSGAYRVLYKHQNYDKLISKLYVAVSRFKCDVETGSPVDLRVMGKVAKFEYDCFACYMEEYDKLPEFNDKKRSKNKI